MKRLFGVFSLASYFLFTLIAVYINKDWWNILNYTLSKLGKPGLASKPYIFSIGLIIGGSFMVVHGLLLILGSKNKLKVVGSSYILLSGVFMSLIGILHDGTPPHDFIALTTFLLFYTGNMIYGFGSKDRKIRLGFSIIFIAALAGLFVPVWPSLGILEIYGISLVLVECILIIFEKEGFFY